MMGGSLWGEEFDIFNSQEKVKKVLEKIKDPKKPKSAKRGGILMRGLTQQEKIQVISSQVEELLGHLRENIIVIQDRQTLHDYITQAISNGVVSIDTETNNSLDPITAKIMGPVFYTPGQQWAYVPINHVNPHTLERLPNQVLEQDIKEELQRLVDANTFVVMHNASFDYNILKMTCNIEIEARWDTQIAAHLLNENELIGLKEQYINNIDNGWAKYNIEGLFKGEKYELFAPEVFALYAAPDGVMTYRLYEHQKKLMELPEYDNLYKLFMNVEMPCVYAVSEMELNGIELDMEHIERLSKKYNGLLDKVDQKIKEELNKYQSRIDAWRLTPDANKIPINAKGNKGVSKNEQLPDEINLNSPTQLAILLYDILEIPIIDTKKPRGTGADILNQINIPFTKLMKERREISKLITSFIDSLPRFLNPVSGRVHSSFWQTGTDTGRFSSDKPNMQNIPQGNTEIRIAFKAGDIYKEVEEEEGYYKFKSYTDVHTPKGWVLSKDLTIGDIIGEDNQTITQIVVSGNEILVWTTL